MPVSKHVLEGAEGCRSCLDSLVDVRVRSEGAVDDEAKVLGLFRDVGEVHRSAGGVMDVESRSVRWSRPLGAHESPRVTRRREVHGLGLRGDVATTHVHLKAELAEVTEEVAGARYEVGASLEEDGAVVGEQRGLELEGRGATLALRALA